MPTDRHNTQNGRPLMPALATTATRSAKAPITPRLAASVASTTAPQTNRTVRSNVASTPRANTGSHDDLSTPVTSFLNSNVTPRSSNRKSRVGVSSSSSTPTATPSGTPSSTRPTSTVDFPSRDQSHAYIGLGLNGSNGAQSGNRPRSVVGANNHYNTNTTPTPRPTNSYLHNLPPPESGAGRNGSPMFFHANDARTPEPAPAPKKAPVFFYANGQQDDSLRPQDVPSPPLSSLGRPQSENKFFHADSISEARGNSPILTPPPVTSSPEPWPTANPTQRPPSLRPPSPSKENIHLSYRKGASQVIRPTLYTRNSALSIISGHGQTDNQATVESNSIQSGRRSSAASAIRLGHAKSSSLSSIDSVTSLKKAAASDLPAIKASPLHTEDRIVSNGSMPESVQSEPTPPKETLSGLPSPSLQSPTKSTGEQSALERMNQLAANARRERKVLDLEISNSSLLAINRQLEKEVRKQKAELRRFRRMSRAGRFSVDTISSDIDGLSAVDVSGIGELSGTSEVDSMLELDDEDPESSSESSFDEGALSPNALAERDAAHHLRDEKRLQLDLSKHRELLVDSQKMNQSLKRCLNWTEELIKDAQKALTYQVRVSDVKLGGRVLSTEEHHEEESTEESRALLSPWTPTFTALNPLDDPSLVADTERTDRDSGVDLDGPKLTTLQLGSPLPETPSKSPHLADALGETY
ncbi:hypothetical protein EJ04DRAFT_52879 [Polyplosphaeria fusca]|uniref:Uncharacterized protein n=1 Tax=Polyplosphaeria fusca TaxID=682080 RepID=A0A9P4R7P3_9PLEO|nr:hypothetical protein EJ04DRAFT_52879 [Polyplosphaeria fusca]